MRVRDDPPLGAEAPAAAGDATSGPAPPFAYQPALDGLRALAVLAVLLYHGNVTWVRGGFLGVDAFFVLSGYLITSLLLIEHSRQGRIALREFWARRARRLLPALFAVLVAVAAYGALSPAGRSGSLWSDGVATLLYIQNWHQILSHQSYFAAAGPVSPLRHAWSLAIEEQWYVFWPLLLGGLLALTGRRRARLAVVVGALAAASAVLMAVLHHGGDPSRVYYGTDTRAQSLLVGSLLAVLLSRRPRLPSAAGRRALDVAALAALGVALWLWSSTASWSGSLYRGGFLVVALLVALVVTAAVQPGPGAVRYLLSRRPLVAVGLVSYGLYLWHWPVYVVMTPARTGLEGTGLLLARLAVSFVAATASYHLVERPFRYGGFARRARWWAVPAGAAVVVGALALGTTGLVVTRPRSEAVEADGDALKLRNPEEVALRRGLNDFAYPPDIVRALVLGDSVALTLGGTSPADPFSRGLVADAHSTVTGCGIMDTPIRGRGIESDQRKCRRLDRFWAQAVDMWRPNVVVLLVGAWEVFDHRIDGEWTEFASPAFRAELWRRLEVVRAAASRYGGRLVILTTPCLDPPDLLGRGWERRDGRRIAWLNRQWYAFAAEHPDRVDVLDLNARVCPGGRYTSTVGGEEVRRPDGVHFTAEGSDLVWRWLAPRLRALAPPAAAIDRGAGARPASG